MAYMACPEAFQKLKMTNKKLLRVLYHVPNSEGGLSEYAMHQGQALARAGDVKLFWQAPSGVSCPDGATALDVLPAQVFRSGRSKMRRAIDFLGASLSVYHSLDKAIFNIRPDAVLLPGWSEYFSPLWAWRLRRWHRIGVRFGAVIHDPVRNFQAGGRFLHSLSLRHAYSFIDVAFVHELLDLDTAGGGKPSTVVVPCGPYPVEDGGSSKSMVRRELGIPQSAVVLLSFGHIRDGKCLDEIIKAMVFCPECHLIVAGRAQSGGQKPVAFYQGLASTLGVADRCHWFSGYIPSGEIWRYFRAADRLLLLYSMDFHSMSAVLNVNAQFRLPVIASAGGGPMIKAVNTYGLGLTIIDTNPNTIAIALKEKNFPAARWEDYLCDHSWDTNARRVVDALSLHGKF